MTPESAAIRIQSEGVTHALIEEFLSYVANGSPYIRHDETAREILRGLEHGGWAGCVDPEDFDIRRR